MTTLVCRVQQRLPVAIVSVFGTIDMDTVARLMVTLHECVANGPGALILDVKHAELGADRALQPLLALREDVRAWPDAPVSLCGASEATAAALHRVAAAGSAGEMLRHRTVRAALAAANGAGARPRRVVDLPAERTSPALGRSATRSACAQWGIARIAPVAEFVVSELVTNAVVHARTAMRLLLMRHPSALSVAVRDGDPRPMVRPDPPRPGDSAGERGRGLLMLDAMADAWGCLPSADGKVVWARIGVPAAVTG